MMTAIIDAVTRRRLAILIIGLLALTAGTILRVRDGIDPYSLWLDDQWVAVLAEHASPAELIQLKPPAPLGFLLLLQGIVAALGSASWPLQILPLTAGLAMIPFTGWLAFRLTDRVALGLFAAAPLAGSRTLAVYSLRVKQFTLEGFIALALIALAMNCLHRRRVSSYLILLGGAVIAPAFSFTAAAVGLVIVNVLALHVILSREEGGKRLPVRIVVAGAAIHDLIVFAWLTLVQARQASDLIFDFWGEYCLPLDDPSALASFMTGPFIRLFTGALPSTLGWFAVGVPIGIALLCGRRGTRLIGFGVLLFYLGLFTASALCLYPIGGRRTDIFTYPVTILTITGAIWALSRWLRWAPAAALLVIIIEMLLFFPAPAVHYATKGGRSAIELAVTLVKDGDALVIAPRANWAVGCYGPWPVELRPARDTTNGFVVQPMRDDTLVMRESWKGRDFREGPSVAKGQLAPLLACAPRRLIFVSIGCSPQVDEWIAQVIESHGYTAQPIEAPRQGTVLLYGREEARDAPQPDSDAADDSVGCSFVTAERER